MSMRLLPRSEINAAKSLDHKREIDEGVKLAKRVDTLREIQSQEELSLSKFRDNSLKEIVEEINQKIRERDELNSGITERREELLQLSGPLDRAWLFYVNTEKAAIDKARQESEQELHNSQIHSKEAQQTLTDLTEKKEREVADLQLRRDEWEEHIKRMREHFQKLNDEADANSSQAAKSLTEAQRLFQENKDEKARLTKLRTDVVEKEDQARVLLAAAKRNVLDAEKKSRIISEEAHKVERAAKDRLIAAAVKESELKMQEDNLAKKTREVEDRELAALAKELLYYSPVKK